MPAGKAGVQTAGARAVKDSRRRHQPKATQPIRDGETYPLEIIPELLGISTEAIRNARKNGLRVGRCGTKVYVSGEELRRFLHGCNDTAAQSGDCSAKSKS
jgi:hypothetical protein